MSLETVEHASGADVDAVYDPARVSPLFNAIGLSLIGSFGGLLVASTLLLFRDGLRTSSCPGS